MTSENLINDIILATEVQQTEPEIVRLKSTEDIISAATILDSETEEHRELDEKEKFHYEIYTELLDDISFRLTQIKSLFYSEFPWEAIKRTEERLLKSLEVLETGINDYYKFIEARLLSEKKEDVIASVFVLSSVMSKDFSSIYLDRLIKKLAGTDKEYINCFTEGLKLGLNNQISSRLDMITEIVAPHVKTACLETIEYRKKFNIDLLYWEENETVQYCNKARQDNDF